MSLVRAGGMFRFGLVGGLVLAGVCAWGQGAAPADKPNAMKLVEPPAPLLPKQIGRMTLGDAVAGFAFDVAGYDLTAGCLIDSKRVASPAPGSERCRSIFKEVGLNRFETGSYAVEAQSRAVHAMEFVDATAAFSAYTFYRSEFVMPKDLAVDYKAGRAMVSATGGRETALWAGTTVVWVEGPLNKAELDDLTTGLPKVGGRKAIPPLLPTLLPADVSGMKLDATSLRYAIGPEGYVAMKGVLPAEILGWEKSVEVATAGYAGHGAKGTLTLLLYPTPQIAGERGRVIEKALNDGQARGTVKLRRVGPLVGMTSGSFTPDQAEKMVQALHLNEEVSFDKPMPLEFHAEVQKTATLLQSISVFVGIMILASVVVGVFLGGGRALVRKMRGLSAASDPEFLTIDLRGRPAPLRSVAPPEKDDPPAA